MIMDFRHSLSENPFQTLHMNYSMYKANHQWTYSGIYPIHNWLMIPSIGHIGRPSTALMNTSTDIKTLRLFQRIYTSWKMSKLAYV